MLSYDAIPPSFPIYIRIINDVINWTRYRFNVYLATPLATKLTRALSASFQGSSIPLWVQTTGEGVTCIAIREYDCSEYWKRWQFREILQYITNHKTLLLHHNFTICPSTGVNESRILSSI